MSITKFLSVKNGNILLVGALLWCMSTATDVWARPCAISHDMSSCEDSVSIPPLGRGYSGESEAITEPDVLECDTDYYDWSRSKAVAYGAVSGTNTRCNSGWICEWCYQKCKTCKDRTEHLRALKICSKEKQALKIGEAFKAEDVFKEDLFYQARQEKYNSQFAHDCESLKDSDTGSIEYTFTYYTEGLCGTCGSSYVPTETECELQEQEGWTSARLGNAEYPEFEKIYKSKFATDRESEFNKPEGKFCYLYKATDDKAQCFLYKEKDCRVFGEEWEEDDWSEERGCPCKKPEPEKTCLSEFGEGYTEVSAADVEDINREPCNYEIDAKAFEKSDGTKVWCVKYQKYACPSPLKTIVDEAHNTCKCTCPEDGEYKYATAEEALKELETSPDADWQCLNVELDTKSQSFGKPDMVVNHERKNSEELLCYKPELYREEVKIYSNNCGIDAAGIGDISYEAQKILRSNGCKRNMTVTNCDQLIRPEILSEIGGSYKLFREGITDRAFLEKNNKFVEKSFAFEDSNGYGVCATLIPVSRACPTGTIANNDPLGYVWDYASHWDSPCIDNSRCVCSGTKKTIYSEHPLNVKNDKTLTLKLQKSHTSDVRTFNLSSCTNSMKNFEGAPDEELQGYEFHKFFRYITCCNATDTEDAREALLIESSYTGE